VRYAIYYAPEAGELLGRLGATWLGRDAEAGLALAQPAVPGVDVARLTAEPRRYGFHATLAPPFAPAPGVAEEAVLNVATTLAETLSPLRLPPLEVRQMGSFIALVQSADSAEVDELAAACVRAFHPLRAAPTATELDRRRKTGLSARQEALLTRWGYPYVFEEFRFHLSLTGPVNAAEADILLPAARAYFATACAMALSVAALTVFHEPAPGEPFKLLARYPLRGRAGS
jgi:putative phosphonate metabolism protein